MRRINLRTLTIMFTLVFVFLFGFSIQAYNAHKQELSNPVSQYLLKNYGVNSVEEHMAKLKHEMWLNYSEQMQSLASEYPEFSEWNAPKVYVSNYQSPIISQLFNEFWTSVGNPLTVLSVFSFISLGFIAC